MTETHKNIEDGILRALRRITRAIDLRSRNLANTFGLTGPQLICLRAINSLGQISASQLAREISLSQGTVTGILDRLSLRQLVKRTASSQDRRLVLVQLTDAGESLVAKAPSPLQEQFVEKLSALPEEKQRAILSTLESVVEMMGGDEFEAAPVLTTSPAAQSEEEVKDVVEAGEVEVSLLVDMAPALEDNVE